MADKEKEEQFKKTQAELNTKIESIMGPTPDNTPVVSNEKDLHLPGQKSDKPASGAPEMPKAKQGSSGEEAAEAKAEAEAQPAAKLKAEEDATIAAATDPDLDKAVDDIAAKESDEVLEAEDKETQAAFAKPEHKTFGQKVKGFFSAWWHNKTARNTTIVVLVLTIIGLAAYPTTRYFFLNTVGVRSSASVVVLDQSTQQPLKKAKVTIGNQSGETDVDGRVKLDHLRLGRSQMTIERKAFAEVDQPVTIGWGSNPMGNMQLAPTGEQYTFNLADFLSSKPIEKAEASLGDASAVSDKNGKIVLTLDKDEDFSQPVTIVAESYRTEEVSLPEDSKQAQTLQMVPARKHAFVSKRSGKFDVFKIDVDGSNEQLVLPGTGFERDDMVLVQHATGDTAALVSTRDNVRNGDGFLLSTLTIINLKDDEEISLGRSERFQIVGWVSDRLVYVQIAAGASANDPKRHRLMSYNATTGENKELASSNYFNDVQLASDMIYYAPSAAYQDGVNISLFKSNADGTNRQVILDQETWNILRLEYDKLTLATQSDWYEYRLGENKASRLSGPPANQVTRVYVDSPDKKQSIWVDQRDGKGVLLVYNLGDKKEEALRSQSGLKNPIRWITDRTVVYRINTEQETADYVISLDGGEPRKIRDVTNTGGIDTWYYY